MLLDQFERPIASETKELVTRRTPVSSSIRIGSMGEAFAAAKRTGYKGMFWVGSPGTELEFAL